MDRARLTTILLDQVSERTGYPPEMLGLDQDIEAELGIDSIKRVEILGALQEKLPAEIVGRVKQQMEALTRVKTLSGLLDRLHEAGDATGVLPTSPTVEPARAEINGYAPDRDELRALLLAQVSERTGYPADMLGLDQDIEAELGIDSIKRVEILGALQERLPSPIVSRVKEQMESLTRVKTLSGLLDRLTEGAAPATVPAAVAAEAVSHPALPDATMETFDRKVLTSLLLNQVSERTGYPTEMLGLDQDIEAELGIDSIKRVEVLGVLQERLPAHLVTRLKEQMDTLTRVKTLNGVVDRLLDGADRSAKAAVARPGGAIAAAPSIPLPDRAEVTALLVQQVSDRTGYPPDMLGLDQDIEAELGIDSIKRVEILGTLQERLPPSVGLQLRDRMETLTRVKTLRGLVDAMLLSVGSDGENVPPTNGHDVVRRGGAVEVPRCRIQAFVEPLPAGGPVKLAGLFLVTGDETPVTSLVSQGLASQGAIPASIDTATLRDAGRLAVRLGDLRSRHGPVSGIVHLAPLAPVAAPQGLDGWREACQVQVKALFQTLRICADDLAAAAAVGRGWVVTASALGGGYGRSESTANLPSAGGVLPLLKTAWMEWPGLIVRSVDFPSDQSDTEIASKILAEFRLTSGHFEIGYPDKRRTAFKTVPAPLDGRAGQQLTPGNDWVVLVTGGARGITAEIAHEISRPGMRLVIVGRTPAPSDEPKETTALADIATLRRFVVTRLGNGKAATPVAVDREVQRIVTDREIRRNLERLRENGAVVDYRSSDVRDGAAFGALIDGLYATYGRIDAVIHGAGVIEDKLIRDKTPESFDRVFDTKVDSAWILAARLRPESLKLLVFFSSVSGRYGNRGQCDYAAANDTLTRFAWHLHGKWPGTRVVSISWGPWDASGMVTDEIRRQFRERGVVAIEPGPGRRFFRDEICVGRLDDVEVVAGAGPWEREPELSPPPAGNRVNGNGVVATTRIHGPALMTTPSQLLGDGTVVAEHCFDLATHAFLNDHRLDGIPVLPAAAALEWMAQFVQASWPDWAVHSIGDVRVFKGIRLDGGNERRVRFRALASSHADAGSLQVSVALVDPETQRENYKAVATLVPQVPAALEQAVHVLAAGEPMDLRKAYREYLFHGPSFQLLTDISKLDALGIDAGAVPSEPARWLTSTGPRSNGNGHAAHWLFDPGLVDAAFQLALVWARVYQGKSALPGHLGSIARYGDEPLSGTLGLHLRISPRTNDNRVVFDAFAADSQGRVRLAMHDMECPSSRALNRLGGTA